MKFSTFLYILVLGAVVWFFFQSPSVKLPEAFGNLFRGNAGPRLALMNMAKEFPKTVRAGDAVTEVSSYMEKNDGDPLISQTGYLTFQCGSTYEYVFNWAVDHWVFAKMLRRSDGRDITTEPEGKNILSTPEMQRFLQPYVVSSDATPLPANSRASLPATVAAPRRTPTPQENALDVARKYGGAK